MAESDVVRIAREYRQQLASNEDEALQIMSKHWVNMEKELTNQFILLAHEVENLTASGQPVPPQYIYNMQRYQQMMAELQSYMGEFDARAEKLISDYQIENYNLGLDSASAIIQASKPSAPIWNKVGKDAAEAIAGYSVDGAPLGDLLYRDYGHAATGIVNALVSGVGLGKGAYATARDMRDVIGKEFYKRAVLIARTEINRSYRIANADAYRASGVVTKVLRLCYPPTACFACLEMDGEECPNGICDDHPNGKCTTVAVTIGGIRPTWETGHQWLMKQSEEDQRRIMGDGRYELWKDGIDPRDMVRMNDNPVWGGSPSVISLSELENRFK